MQRDQGGCGASEAGGITRSGKDSAAKKVVQIVGIEESLDSDANTGGGTV